MMNENDFPQLLEYIKINYKKYIKNSPLEAKRLFHGRGKMYSGFEWINIDYYPPILSVFVYTFVSKEILKEICKELLNLNMGNITGLVVQDRSGNSSKYLFSLGSVPEEIHIKENNQLYRLFPKSSQNLGFFMDMRNTRKWVFDNTKDQRVLNLFLYTCSFSVSALKGGAIHVDNWDMKRNFLNIGKDNHLLNKIDTRSVSYFPHNILKSFGKIQKRGPYDLIIFDPPSNQDKSFYFYKDYPKVLKRIPNWLNRGGIALLCCNLPGITIEDFESLIIENTSLNNLGRINVPSDFEEKDESGSLKVVISEKID